MTLKQLCSAVAATTVAASAFSAPLSIEKQGTFAVGGTVKTSAGTYNPHKAAVAAGGMTLHGDHATVH